MNYVKIKNFINGEWLEELVWRRFHSITLLLANKSVKCPFHLRKHPFTQLTQLMMPMIPGKK